MKSRSRAQRLLARRRGQRAEFWCRWHLRLRGWRIIARDWRCPSGEIDILARRGKVLAVIEVKSRSDFGAAAMSLLPRQRRRIARAATAFLLTRPDLAGLAMRFDVMLVAPRRPPRHLPGAWHHEE
ncbi:MAG TPA: YraN family protein [Stellaceae bacterium]|jgi:putative endonuclease|nr:YraN family protein [Stellaceae bacterium]